MRKLKIEYTAFDYKDFVPNNLFFKELSSQITPKVVELVTDNVMCENLPDLICLSVNSDSYLSPSYKDGINYMRMDISSRSASLIICEVVVLWYVASKCKINPWDDFQSNIIYFDLLVQNSEIKTLNAMLPKIYHPVVKSIVSGLPYDYQIFYGGQALVITTSVPITSESKDIITDTFKDFIKKSASYDMSEADSYNSEICGKTSIKIHVDPNECNNKVVESMIRCFSGIDFIKKIVFR